MTIWPWFGNVVLGNVYDAAEFLDAGSYQNVQRWAGNLMGSRTSGEGGKAGAQCPAGPTAH
ncbi:hypothetical protein KCP73_16610 [Salmonella enterica subsp. enterica]|nr:hypothetical protein KCP73_16610 [Salmonella enterica subsp. enterica]